MRPAAFLFDLDGTLIDSERSWAAAIEQWVTDHGESTDRSELAGMLCGRSWPDIHAALHKRFPKLGETSHAEDSAALKEYHDRLVKDPAEEAIPSAVAFMRKVSKLAPCAVVSGSPHDDVVRAVAALGLETCVKFVLGAEDCGRGKPAPDGYLKAAMMLDVDASECVVVEDSTAGVAAGRAAGMRVLGVDRNEMAKQDFCGCEWLVHDLAELNAEATFDA